MKLLLLIAFITSASMTSADPLVFWFPPYSDDIHQLLSGIWSTDATMAPGGRLEHFSWGEAYVWPNDSRIIDLRSEKPCLLMAGGDFEIMSIESIDKTQLKMNMRLIPSKKEVGFIVVYILGKDKIRFENHLQYEGTLGFLFERQLYRHYGPENPVLEGK
jgi:hypothetical protein